MSETLQSSRIQTARALSKLQATQNQSSSSSSSPTVASTHPILAAPVSSPAISIPHSHSVQDSMGHSIQTTRLTVGHTASCTRHSAGIGSIKKKQRMRASTGPSNHRLKSHKWYFSIISVMDYNNLS